MDDMNKARPATPSEQLRSQLMDPSHPKTEMEHWAARHIAELERKCEHYSNGLDYFLERSAECEDVTDAMKLWRDIRNTPPAASLARRDLLVAADALRDALDEIEIYPDTSATEVMFDIEDIENRLRREANDLA